MRIVFQLTVYFRCQRRVAFLPFARVQLKSLIPKEWDFEPKTLGEHIKKKRLQLRVHQKDTALIFGVDTATIHNWEIGNTKPENHRIPTLVKYLGYDPEPPHPTSVANHFKTYRRQYGLSQKQAAKRLGVDPSTWSRWECGGTILPLEQRKRVSRFLGLSFTVVNSEMKQQWNKQHNKPTTFRAHLNQPFMS